MSLRRLISWVQATGRDYWRFRGAAFFAPRAAYLRKALPQRGQGPLFFMHCIILLVLVYARPTFFSTVIGATVSGTGWLLFLWMEGYASPEAESLPCGPFRFSRHPYLFTGFLVILGLCLASRAFIPLVVLLTAGGAWVQAGMRISDHKRSPMPHQEFLRYRLFIASFLPTLLPYPTHESAQPFALRRAFATEHHRVVKWLLLLSVLYCALFIYPDLPRAVWWQWGSALVYGLWMIKHFFFHDIGHKIHMGH